MRWLRSRRPPIPDPAEVVEVIGRNVTLADSFGADVLDRLVELTGTLVGTKRWEAVGDLVITPEIQITIAANAAVPLLALDPWLYRQVQSILVLPSTTTTTGRRSGPAAGTVSDHVMAIVGEATPHSGPLSIAWDAALRESRHPVDGRNVVIHEFAHKIDMNDGYSDGVPALSGDDLSEWLAVLDDEYGRAEGRRSDAVMRPYAWASPAEFFAVSTETFFCTPRELSGAKPRLYDALRNVYRQDPAERLHADQS